MDKSYVTMERRHCLVCDKEYDTGSILLDKRLGKRFEMYTTVGYGLCPEHKKEGFATLIVCKPIDGVSQRVRPEAADRTGEVIYIRKEAAEKLFNVPIIEVAYIDEEAAAKIKAKITPDK